VPLEGSTVRYRAYSCIIVIARPFSTKEPPTAYIVQRTTHVLQTPLGQIKGQL